MNWWFSELFSLSGLICIKEVIYIENYMCNRISEFKVYDWLRDKCLKRNCCKYFKVGVRVKRWSFKKVYSLIWWYWVFFFVCDRIRKEVCLWVGWCRYVVNYLWSCW